MSQSSYPGVIYTEGKTSERRSHYKHIHQAQGEALCTSFEDAI